MEGKEIKNGYYMLIAVPKGKEGQKDAEVVLTETKKKDVFLNTKRYAESNDYVIVREIMPDEDIHEAVSNLNC